MATRSDPGQDHADDHRPEQDLQEQREDADQRPGCQEQHVNRVTTEQQDDREQGHLHDQGQHERRHVQAEHARDNPAQRLEQWLRGLDGELAERVVEVRPHQLQDETQQHDQKIQAAQGLDHKNGSVIESEHC
ncbi:hypothetical protein D3C80_1535870 [compost metagenome]